MTERTIAATIGTVYLDLDGVLVDFIGGCRLLFPEIPDPWPAGAYDLPDICGVSGNAFWRRIDAAGEEWWEALEPLPWAQELVDLAYEIGSDVMVLSSPAIAPCSLSGKARWMYKYFGAGFRRYILTPHKHLLARPGDILIDDNDVQTLRFREAGGHAILMPQPWNAAHALAGDPFGAVSQALAAIDALRGAA